MRHFLCYPVRVRVYEVFCVYRVNVKIGGLQKVVNIRKLENELWEAADLLRQGSKLTSSQYCMPVLGIIFLRYAQSRFKKVEAEILKDRPSRNGRILPVEPSDFIARSALYLPEQSRYDYLVDLPENIALGEAVNNAMLLIEAENEQLNGVLPKNYTDFPDDVLASMLRVFHKSELDTVDDDIIGRIYEYFLNKFAPNVASDDGVFFTPKSLVKLIVSIIEPKRGIVFDPACGSGGMFVQSGDFECQCCYDILRSGKSRIQRPIMPNEHNNTRPQRRYQVRQRSQHLLP